MSTGPGRPSRRVILGGSAALVAGVGGLALGPRRGTDGADQVAVGSAESSAAEMVPYHGPHQAGVTTPQQAHATFVGLNLRRGADKKAIAGMLTMLTDDAARLCSGRLPRGALESTSAAAVANLTVTFGFGPGLFAAAAVPERCPEPVRAVPRFGTDALDPRWGQTDLLLQICSDDATGLAYAQRRLLRDATHLASVAWVQRGFVDRGHEPGSPADASPRNLLGLRDGSANERDPQQLANVVWSPGPGAMAGGTQLILRRIRLDLGRWDDIDTLAKDLAFGRRLADGSALSSPAGTSEFMPINREAVDADGFTMVPPNSHAARAQARTGAERMLRRAYNYDDGVDAKGDPDAGLLFAAYQADIATAFVPVQRRLAEADALNTWSTHVGSAAYAVPPGVAPGEWVGQSLLTAAVRGPGV